MRPDKSIYQNRKYFLQRPFVVSFWARAFAKILDFGVVFLLVGIIPYPWGCAAGILYLSCADVLFPGQSLGKRWIGLSVISLVDGSICTCTQSLVRNIPFVLPMLVLFYPVGIWRWSFLLFFFPTFIFLEVFILYKMGTGLRLGDLLADTTVIGHGGFQKIGNQWYSKLIPKWLQDEEISYC